MSPTTWSSTSSATPRVPSPTLHRHRDPGHRQRNARQAATAVRKACLSVSRHCPLSSIEQGNLWEKAMSMVSRETLTVLTASFLKTPKLRKWVDRTGNLWEKAAQMHRFGPLLEQRQMIIAEYCEKIGHHELQAGRAEEERRMLQEELWRQQKDFREVHQQSLTEMEELRKFPEFYLRYARKTDAHRGPEHYYGIFRKITRTYKVK